MTISMDDSHITRITQIKEFLKVDKGIRFKALSKQELYDWVNGALTKFRYIGLRKRDKGILRRYMATMTGLSQSQTTRLIAKKKRFGKTFLSQTRRHSFPKKYGSIDIARLLETDNYHQRLSGPATKEILRRECDVFGHQEYQNIKRISSSHIYNLRATRQYQSHALTFKKTDSRKIPIGERRKPEPCGRPGYLRVDTVHQGDLDKEKGVYHINIADEVIQWEIVGCAEKISEHFLIPLLEEIIKQFPFVVLGFHSDNGSEFINKVVAKLLNKLLIRQTKSRARHTNDNALIESKNGSIIRKHIGYRFIPKDYAPVINQFYQEYLNIYLNYHRPCGYATIVTDNKGKQKKIYNVYQTPYERLKSLPNGRQRLRPGITFEILDKIAYGQSDNECASLMQGAKDKLFSSFNCHKLQFPTVYTNFISCSSLD